MTRWSDEKSNLTQTVPQFRKSTESESQPPNCYQRRQWGSELPLIRHPRLQNWVVSGMKHQMKASLVSDLNRYRSESPSLSQPIRMGTAVKCFSSQIGID